MPHKKIKPLLTILLTTILCYANWETFGGNSARNSFLNVVGPESPNEILWEGSLPSNGGWPILISNNKLVTCRAVNWEDAPLVCHDLFTGDTLWTKDFGGGSHSTSIPLGFRENVVYAANWFGNTEGDTLFAIDAHNGEIKWFTDIGVLGVYNLGIAFTDNGDLILPLPFNIVRINHLNGDTVWCIERIVPVISDYCGLAVFNQTAYGWAIIANELQLIAINVETGEIKYGKGVPTTHPPVNIWSAPLPVVSPSGIVYMYRPEDNLVAFKDTKDSLAILWNVPIREGGNTKPSIGLDGSVYFTHHNRIMRADTETGEILDSSIIIWNDTITYINALFSTDAKGTVFFNTNYGGGILYSFTKNLKLNWTDSIDVMGYGGPALSKHGLLAVAGKGNILRVYKPVNLKTKKILVCSDQTEISYFLTPHLMMFKYYVQHRTNVNLILYNLRGQTIYSRNNLPNKSGFNMVRIDDSNLNIISGTYIYKLQVGSKTQTNTLHISK